MIGLIRPRFIAVCALLFLSCGCGSGLPSGETGTVRGRVTYNGQSVPEGCGVLFQRSEDGIAGIGTTNPNGEYILSMRDGLKIVTGTYRVSVSPPNPAASADQDKFMELSMAGKIPDPSKFKEVPMRYRADESTLIFHVSPGANTFDIEMKD